MLRHCSSDIGLFRYLVTYMKLPRPVRNKLIQYLLLQVGVPQKPQKKTHYHILFGNT